MSLSTYTQMLKHVMALPHSRLESAGKPAGTLMSTQVVFGGAGRESHLKFGMIEVLQAEQRLQRRPARSGIAFAARRHGTARSSALKQLSR